MSDENLSPRERLAIFIAPGIQKKFVGGSDRPDPTVQPDHARAGKAMVKPGGGQSFPTILSPLGAEDAWRINLLDENAFSKVSPQQLLAYLVDLSPEVSKAAWDYLRMLNTKVTIDVRHPGSERSFKRGNLALKPFLKLVANQHGTFNEFLGKLFFSVWLRGAVLTELIFDDDGATPLGLAVVDPYHVQFRRVPDDIFGTRWQLGQYQGGQWVALERETIRYLPIDPLPGSPYGRALVSPAVFSALFLLGLLHDLRRVISQQGYPRLDLVIELEKLVDLMPDADESDPTAIRNWVNDVIDEVQDAYAQLDPGDLFIHTDALRFNAPVGTMSTGALGIVDTLLRSVERMAIRGLKTMPIFMGSNESVTETHAEWQWLTMSVSITSLQGVISESLAYSLGMVLRAQGIQGDVFMEFEEINDLVRRRQVEVEAIEIANAARKRDEGWITQDEAATEVVGHGAVGDPLPNAALAGIGTQSAGARSWGRADEDLKGSDKPLPDIPPASKIVDDKDIEKAIASWDDLMAVDGLEGLLEAEYTEGGEGDTPDDLDVDLASGNAAGIDVSKRSAEFSEAMKRLMEGLTGEPDEPPAFVRAGDDRPRWVWEQAGKRYRDRETGRWISQDTMLAYRDRYLERQFARSDRLTGRLFAKDITIQDWTLGMRQVTKETYLAEYMAAKGGRNAMTQSDWGRSGRMLRDQYGYLNRFAGDLQDGKLSEAQATYRARLYVSSGAQAFEAGKVSSFGMPSGKLPAMPADGSTTCMTNCRCHWRIVEFSDRWECDWIVDPAAESCGDCIERGRAWVGLIVEKP